MVAPAGQRCPGGHAVADGLGVVLPEGQLNPAAHTPAGAVAPTVSQYEPAGHMTQALALVSATFDEYVPIGHGVATAEPVEPAGEVKRPTTSTQGRISTQCATVATGSALRHRARPDLGPVGVDATDLALDAGVAGRPRGRHTIGRAITSRRTWRTFA